MPIPAPLDTRNTGSTSTCDEHPTAINTSTPKLTKDALSTRESQKNQVRRNFAKLVLGFSLSMAWVVFQVIAGVVVNDVWVVVSDVFVAYGTL